MRCTCCSKLTDGTKAETNASLQDLTLLMVCLQFEKFDFIYQNQQRSLENRITFGKLTSTDEASLSDLNLIEDAQRVCGGFCCKSHHLLSVRGVAHHDQLCH